jgi:hypothetical protein
MMLKQDVQPNIMQKSLGHCSIEMTLDIYSCMAPGLRQKAAEAFETAVNPAAV